MRLLLYVCLVVSASLGWLADTVNGQTAIYAGRSYTPASFPRAIYHTDTMCMGIKVQWVQDGWIPPPGAPMPNNWRAYMPQRTVTRTRTVTPAVVAPATVTRTRTVQRTRRVPYRVRVCHGSYCTYETRYRIETYFESVPVQAPPVLPVPAIVPAPAPVPSKLTPAVKPTSAVVDDQTSPALARALMELIRPTAADVVIDLGCADGNLLAAAMPFGSKLIGIELDKDRATRAAERLPSALIVHGDILHQTYAEGTVFLAYQFPDLIERVLPLLPVGQLVVLLEHDAKGLNTVEHRISVGGKEHIVFIGVKS